MDYEKAYNAVLKTATQWIKDGCTDKEKICLECVFPELRESEDEKVRKWIIEEFKIHYDFESPSLNPMVEKAIAWLERQKEQKPAEWSEEDKDMREITISDLETLKNWIRKHDAKGATNPCIPLIDGRISWLKSLPSRIALSKWKPSEEQMAALKNVAFGSYQNGDGPTIRELYNDLKKL